MSIEKNIIDLYGDEGKQWFDNLPNLILQLAKEYGLSQLKPFENLSYNYVLSGVQNKQPIVLKIGLDHRALQQEAFTIHAFSGCGVVKLIDKKEGLLLLEQAIPGIPLKSYFPEKENDSINIAAKCIQQLHRARLPENHQFPHIQDWLITLNHKLDIPAQYLNKARIIRDELFATSSASILLHGDLHHENIIKNGEDWIAIDPKGVIGEPAYEVPAFIRNPMPQLLANPNATNIINQRIKRFAELLHLAEQRIHNWCYVQAVLAWAWALNDNCDTVYFERFTKLIEPGVKA